MHVLTRAAIALIATVALAACGGAGTTPATSAGPATSNAPAAAGCAKSATAGTVAATIANFKFSPDSIQAKVGDVVTWTNNDSASHTVTIDSGACDAGTVASGSSASLVFTVAGTYTYHCSIHPSMKGTVVVSG
jgi:plastocyanin